MENAEMKFKILSETLMLFVQKQMNEIDGEEILLAMEASSIQIPAESLLDALKKGNDLNNYTYRKGALGGKIKTIADLLDIINNKIKNLQ